MKNLEFPVFLVSDEGRQGTNFVTDPDRSMLIVCRDEDGAVRHGLVTEGLKEPHPVKVLDLITLQDVLGSVIEALPSMKWILVTPYSGETRLTRMRISTFLKKQKGRADGR